MHIMDNDEFCHEMKKGLGEDGDLVLIICCKKCDAKFELNREAVALAILMKITLIEYIRYVQNGKCSICNTNN